MMTMNQVREVPWKIWALVLVVAAPVVGGAFAMGAAAKDHALIRAEYLAGLEAARIERDAIRIKTDYAYDQATKGQRFTHADGEGLKARVNELERQFDQISIKLAYLVDAVKEIRDSVSQKTKNTGR